MSIPDKTFEDRAHSTEQASRMQKLFCAVVLAALDDAIKDERSYGNGADRIARWSHSRDGREVLTMAGIEPSQIVTDALVDFVYRGIKTSTALTQKD